MSAQVCSSSSLIPSLPIELLLTLQSCPPSAPQASTLPIHATICRRFVTHIALPHNSESIFYELEALVSAAFVFAQGMLAGVGLVLLLIGFGNSTIQTLAAISSISVQLERATFFLALTSAAGSINKLCVDNACNFHGSRTLVYYDFFAVCLHVTCVIFTILAAPVDEIMFHSTLRVPGW